MRSENLHHADERAEPTVEDFDRYTSYEDGDHHVICDTRNPQAWIRSDVTGSLDP